jgi:hypothetical protein
LTGSFGFFGFAGFLGAGVFVVDFVPVGFAVGAVAGVVGPALVPPALAEWAN